MENKIYISGKITGDEKFLEKFERAEEELKAIGWEVVNPAKVNAMLPKCTTWDEYMKMSITMLDMCDTICMLKDWKNSKGACIEYGYALASDKTIIFE